MEGSGSATIKLNNNIFILYSYPYVINFIEIQYQYYKLVAEFVMGRVCMGRFGYGPSLSWTEFVMGRVVQLPYPSIGVVVKQFYSLQLGSRKALCLKCKKESFSRKGLLFAKMTVYNTKRSFIGKGV